MIKFDSKSGNKWSFKLSPESKKVYYAKGTEDFLKKVKNIIRSKSQERVVALDTYFSKTDFELIICHDLLHLECCSRYMDTSVYIVPEDLSLESFDLVYSYDAILSVRNADPMYKKRLEEGYYNE